MAGRPRRAPNGTPPATWSCRASVKIRSTNLLGACNKDIGRPSMIRPEDDCAIVANTHNIRLDFDRPQLIVDGGKQRRREAEKQ